MGKVRTTPEPRPILIVGIDGRKVTLEMVFRTNDDAVRHYEGLTAACRAGRVALNLEVMPHD